MPKCKLPSLLVLLSVACTGESKEAGFGVPTGEPSTEGLPNDSEVDDTAVANDGSYQVGDAILTTSTYPDPPLNNGQIIDEWVDVAIYDDSYAVQVGVSGIGLVSTETGEVLDRQNTGRGYSVDSDGDLIVVGSRTHRISLWRFQEGETLSPAGFIEGQGVHEKVAVDGDLIAVAWRDRGVRLYQSSTDVQMITTIDADNAYAVDIVGDRLVYADGQQLYWMDVSDPNSPLELDRLTLDSEVRDIETDGEHIVLGLGGNGVQLLSVENDGLIALDEDAPQGTVFSVSLDDSQVWVASWDATTLYDIQGGTLLPLAQETPLSAAMGVAASNGRAIVADWYQSTVLQRVADRWGPEIHLPGQVRFRIGEASSQILWVQNHGAQPLEVAFDNIPTGFSVEHVQTDGQSTRVSVGGQEAFRISAPAGNWNPQGLSWTSNDPDEPTGNIEIRPSNAAEGSLHPDFALPVVDANGLQSTARLSDFQGKVLFLAWWSDY